VQVIAPVPISDTGDSDTPPAIGPDPDGPTVIVKDTGAAVPAATSERLAA